MDSAPSSSLSVSPIYNPVCRTIEPIELPDNVKNFQSLLTYPTIAERLQRDGIVVIKNFGQRVHPLVHSLATSSPTMVEFLRKLDPNLPRRRLLQHGFTFHTANIDPSTPCLVMDRHCSSNTEKLTFLQMYNKPGPVLDPTESGTTKPDSSSLSSSSVSSSSVSSSTSTSVTPPVRRGRSSQANQSSSLNGWDWDHLVSKVLPGEILLYGSDVDNVSILSYERNFALRRIMIENQQTLMNKGYRKNPSLHPVASIINDSTSMDTTDTVSLSSVSSSSSFPSYTTSPLHDLDMTRIGPKDCLFRSLMQVTGITPRYHNSNKGKNGNNNTTPNVRRKRPFTEISESGTTTNTTNVDPETSTTDAVTKDQDTTATATNAMAPGMTSCYTYFGKAYACFAAHAEDHNLPSINQLVYGAPKVWYAIPPSHYVSATETLRSSVSRGEIPSCAHAIAHKLQIPSLALLQKHQIPVHRVIQNCGDLIITGAGAIHFGMNCGDNIAESTNIADASWINYGSFSDFQSYGPCTCKMEQNPWSLIPRVYLSTYFIESRLDAPFLSSIGEEQRIPLPSTTTTTATTSPTNASVTLSADPDNFASVVATHTNGTVLSPAHSTISQQPTIISSGVQHQNQEGNDIPKSYTSSNQVSEEEVEDDEKDDENLSVHSLPSLATTPLSTIATMADGSMFMPSSTTVGSTTITNGTVPVTDDKKETKATPEEEVNIPGSIADIFHVTLPHILQQKHVRLMKQRGIDPIYYDIYDETNPNYYNTTTTTNNNGNGNSNPGSNHTSIDIAPSESSASLSSSSALPYPTTTTSTGNPSSNDPCGTVLSSVLASTLPKLKLRLVLSSSNNNSTSTNTILISTVSHTTNTTNEDLTTTGSISTASTVCDSSSSSSSSSSCTTTHDIIAPFLINPLLDQPIDREMTETA